MDEERLEFRFSRWMALVPFVFFIAVTVLMSFANYEDMDALVLLGAFSIVVGMFFAKDLDKYWAVVLKGLGSKLAVTMVMLWHIVGIYGSILRSGHIVDGLVWVSVHLGLTGAVFTVCAFIFAALFAVATGSGFSTISTMSFILYPAGVLLGCNPAVLAGAILSGAAFGDNCAPVSDVTIVSAASQEYKHRDGSASIGGTVKARYGYVLVAGIIAIVLFYVFGGSGSAMDSAQASQLLAQYQKPTGLLLLIPTCVIIFMAVKGCNIFQSLSTGCVLAIIIGLAASLFQPADLINLHEGHIDGALIVGIKSMFNVSMMLMLVVAMGEILIASGCMESVMNWLNDSVIKSDRDAEMSMICLTTLFSILIAAVNTIANICVSPFVNAIGKEHDIHPYRRANILAATVSSFPYIVPYGGAVLLMMGGIAAQREAYSFLPAVSGPQIIPTTFYCWAIWLVMMVCCFIGRGRAFEGEHGEYIPAKTNPNAVAEETA